MRRTGDEAAAPVLIGATARLRRAARGRAMRRRRGTRGPAAVRIAEVRDAARPDRGRR